MANDEIVKQVIKIIELYSHLEDAEEILRQTPTELHRVIMVNAFNRVSRLSKKLNQSVDQNTPEFQKVIYVGLELIKNIRMLTLNDEG
ncbi:hypothetical protein UFOVP244_171 [uncultured Caudovirales phage]|uniref:Uncharacterized protein n=1 Tax=uncultured Caudovirales phage TaxID=2100421 RepID=A0A6J7WZH4_9CAUD|nr:hypothetical protein UFOVP244_171 [uncultured Caudovirales phage]